jgi:hypothetical protein
MTPLANNCSTAHTPDLISHPKPLLAYALTFAFYFISLFGSDAIGQNLPGKELHVKKATSAIILDGELNEGDWTRAEAASSFFQNYPNDSLPASHASEAYLTFDDRYLYFAFKCFTKKPITQTMRRDYGDALVLHDVIYMSLGGFADKANANWFGVSFPGVQYDGSISNGGDSEDSYSDFWDAKWYTKTKKYDGYWIAENAIPFKSFRYSNSTPLDVNFLRGDASTNERSHWVRIPVQYMVGSQAFTGKVITDQPLPVPGKNVVLIPYSTFSASKEPGTSGVQDYKAGFDAKIGIATAMNLDITFNPDFSHVEVDQQIVNLTRFEFNFPERRQFFLENSDLFGQLGLPLARPFFTRRLGLAADSMGVIRKVPILYGIRFSGKPGKAWRTGLMNLHTRSQSTLGLPDQNYTMAVVQRRVLSRSFVSAFFINKQNINVSETDSGRYLHPQLLYSDESSNQNFNINRFNRVFGAEFNLLTVNNKWSGKGFYHHATNSFKETKRNSYGLLAEYNTRDWGLRLMQQSTQKNFRAETGFIPGLDIYPGLHNSTVRVRRSYYPSDKKLVKAEPYVEGNVNILPAGSLTDYSALGGTQLFFLNQSSIKGEIRRWFQKLPADFNPIGPRGDTTFLRGEQFAWNDYELQFLSDPRKKISYTLGYSGGAFYSGSRSSLFGELVFRAPPYLTFSTLFNYSNIRLPEVYGSAAFLLLSPKLDITFTPNLFFTALLQYNDRYDNVNLNARVQWRFKPLSDLFIVYTEDYFPNGLGSKQRALVLKATYWLNL